MDNVKNDGYFVKKIINDLSFIEEHTKNIQPTMLEENEILVDSVMFRLIQVSENSNKLTEEFKTINKNIPWRAIKGLRNKIVHEYGNVDMSVIYDTVKTDIPQLLKMLKKLEN